MMFDRASCLSQSVKRLFQPLPPLCTSKLSAACCILEQSCTATRHSLCQKTTLSVDQGLLNEHCRLAGWICVLLGLGPLAAVLGLMPTLLHTQPGAALACFSEMSVVMVWLPLTASLQQQGAEYVRCCAPAVPIHCLNHGGGYAACKRQTEDPGELVGVQERACGRSSLSPVTGFCATANSAPER